MKDFYKKESPILTLPSLAGGFTGSAAETYWLATYGGSNREGNGATTNPRVAVSPSGDVYIGTYSASTDNNSVSGSYAIVAKYDKSGTIKWQRKYEYDPNGSGHGGELTAMAADSSGNLYIAGYTGQPFTGSTYFGTNIYVAKFNSSGTIQWTRMAGTTNTSSTYSQNLWGIDIDSSDDVWLVGDCYARSQNTSRKEILVVKYDSSGTHQFSRYIGNSSGWPHRNIRPNGIFVGSTKYYTCGHFYDASNTDYRMFLTSNLISNHSLTSPSKQIQGQYLGTRNQFYGAGVVEDSSGNVYVAGNSSPSGGHANHIIVFCFASDGTKQWQQFMEQQYANMYCKDIKIDGDDNIYIIGYSSSSSNPYGESTTMQNYVIAKWNSSGTFQWSRAMGTLISYSGGNPYYYQDNDYGISLDILRDNVYFAGTTQSGGGRSTPSSSNQNSYDALFAKVPNDGSLAGYSGGGTAGTYNHNTNRSQPQIPIYYFDGGYTSSTKSTYESIASNPMYNLGGTDASSYITSASVTPTITTMDYDSYTTPME